MTVWNIYYQSREFAKEMGDPLLGQVQAENAEEALARAERDPEIACKAYPGAGLWAVPEIVVRRNQARAR